VDWSGLFSRATNIMAAEAERRHAQVATTVRDGVISFAGGTPDSALFPIEAFRRVLNRVIRDSGASLLQYHAGAGYPPLRAYLSTYLLRFGIEAGADEILIVNGSQQGFDLIARTFVNPGDVVAIEEPTYPSAMQALRAYGAQLVTVPWDASGPRPDLLARSLERYRPKLFYCQPTAHNPTGLTISPEVARRVLEAAAHHQVPVVEDGFDGNLYYEGRRPQPLRARDRDGLVIYVGTFSKILFPGLRLGWVVAPAPVIERLQLAKQLADLHTSPVIQAAVHRFCEQRLLDRHVARMTAEYGRRRAELLAALRRHMPAGVSWTEPRGGFSLLLTLPPGLSAVALLSAAARRGVSFTPGSLFFADGRGEETLRLSFSMVPARRIDEGIRRLTAALQECRQQAGRQPVERAMALVV
jgi:DNA-binding transcriptional MocR family regulator